LCDGFCILAVVRPQIDRLRSIYAQHVKDPCLRGTHSLMETFDAIKNRSLYFEALEAYEEAYPWKRIRVLPYGPRIVEELIREIGADPEGVGVPVTKNVSPGPEAVEVMRRLNAIPMRMQTRLRINNRLFDKKDLRKNRSAVLTGPEADIIKDFYAGSNRNLFLKYGIDLDREEAEAGESRAS
jgi:hypothetical protein